MNALFQRLHYSCILSSCFFGLTVALAQAEPAPHAEIVVVGHAEKSFKPDYALIQMGTTTQSPSPSEAMEQSNKVIQKVLQNLKENFKLDDKNIQTSTIDLRYIEPYDRGKGSQSAYYRARNILTVKVQDLSMVGNILQQALIAGLDHVEDLKFGISSEQEIKSALNAKAIEDAFEQAKVLADAAHVKLGRVVYVSPQNQYVAFRTLKGAQLGLNPTNMSSVPIASGQLTIRSSVDVKFNID